MADAPYHLRRADRAISDEETVNRLLAEGKYATIALADAGEPYLVTLSYGYDQAASRLCFHVAPKGRKLDIISRNPRACATVIADGGYVAGECEHVFESVVLFGKLRVLEDPDETRAAMRVLIGQLETPDHAQQVWSRTNVDSDARLKTFRALVFDIESWTAKRGR